MFRDGRPAIVTIHDDIDMLTIDIDRELVIGEETTHQRRLLLSVHPVYGPGTYLEDRLPEFKGMLQFMIEEAVVPGPVPIYEIVHDADFQQANMYIVIDDTRYKLCIFRVQQQQQQPVPPLSLMQKITRLLSCFCCCC